MDRTTDDEIGGRSLFPIFDEITGAEVVDRKLCLVLGRLFKLHPTFDDMVASIVERLYQRDALISSSAATASKGGGQWRNGTRVVIVFIAEDDFKLNDIVYRRLSAAVLQRLLQSRPPPRIDGSGEEGEEEEEEVSASTRAQRMMRRYVRFYRYETHYHALLRHADVVLDTYPYGGTTTPIYPSRRLIMMMMMMHAAAEAPDVMMMTPTHDRLHHSS